MNETTELVAALGVTGIIALIVAGISWFIYANYRDNKAALYTAIPATVAGTGFLIAAAWVPVFW